MMTANHTCPYACTFLTTNGVRLHTIIAGPENGAPVVLLHGFPEFWYGWRHQIPVLAAHGCRVIVPDQRGYNLSDKPPRVADYNMDALSDDVLGLLDALGYERATLVGHDWGAAVAWWTALRAPERLHALVILNVPHPGVMRRYARRHLSQLRKSWYMFFFQIPRLPEWLIRMRGFAAGRRALLTTSRPGAFSQEDIARYVEAWQQPGALTAMINWYRALFRHPPQRLPHGPRVRVPTHILWGKRDAFLEHEMASLSRDLCDQGRLTFFDDATHWLQHEEPDAVNEAILDMVQAHKEA